MEAQQEQEIRPISFRIIKESLSFDEKSFTASYTINGSSYKVLSALLSQKILPPIKSLRLKIELFDGIAQELPNIIRALSRLTSLEELDIDMSSCAVEKSVKGWAWDLAFLGSNFDTKLWHVEQSSVNFTLEGLSIKKLKLLGHLKTFDFSLLLRSNTLEYLDLSNCYITYAPLVSLLKVCNDIPSLRVIDLQNNPIAYTNFKDDDLHEVKTEGYDFSKMTVRLVTLYERMTDLCQRGYFFNLRNCLERNAHLTTLAFMKTEQWKFFDKINQENNPESSFVRFSEHLKKFAELNEAYQELLSLNSSKSATLQTIATMKDNLQDMASMLEGLANNLQDVGKCDANYSLALYKFGSDDHRDIQAAYDLLCAIPPQHIDFAAAQHQIALMIGDQRIDPAMLLKSESIELPLSLRTDSGRVLAAQFICAEKVKNVKDSGDASGVSLMTNHALGKFVYGEHKKLFGTDDFPVGCNFQTILAMVSLLHDQHKLIKAAAKNQTSSSSSSGPAGFFNGQGTDADKKERGNSEGHEQDGPTL